VSYLAYSVVAYLAYSAKVHKINIIHSQNSPKVEY